MELDRAVLHLLAFVHDAGRRAVPSDPGEADMSPRSLREGLALLQIRVRNLQRSWGWSRSRRWGSVRRPLA